MKPFLRPQDEILVIDTGSTDQTDKVAERCGARVIRRPDLCVDMRREVEEWVPEYLDLYDKAKQFKGGVLRSFSEARNFALNEAENDIQFWIDSDDTFVEEKPGLFRKHLEDGLKQANTIFLNYEYDFDREDGSCTTIHKRERVYDRRIYRWKGYCHEVLVPRNGTDPSAAWFSDVNSVIRHMADARQPGKVSDLRNYLILRKAIEKEEENGHVDPRTIYYFANATRGLGKPQDALSLYKLFLNRSGSIDDCFNACHSITTIYLSNVLMRPAQALHWAYELLKIKNEDPRAYFQISHANFMLKRWHECTHWFQMGRVLPEPAQGCGVYNPQQIHSVPYYIAALAYKELGDTTSALQCVEHLREQRPDHPDTSTLADDVSNWIAGKRLEQAILTVVQNQDAKDDKQLKDGIRRVSASVRTVPEGFESRGGGPLEPKDDRPGRDISFYCSWTDEEWGPYTVKQGKGGSERATWEVSRRFQNAGWKTTVYSRCPKEERGIDPETGVLWRHFGEFDLERPRDTIVFWRSPALLELPVPARQRYLWCHDVQRPSDWTLPRSAIVDKVFVLSEYHKSTLGGKLPDDKVVLSRNGIDPVLFDKKVEKNPKKIVFASSPDRGVLTSMKIFQLAQEEDPELEFHIFYGFTPFAYAMYSRTRYGYIPDLGHAWSYNEYMRLVYDTADSIDGVHWRGRLEWEELAEEFLSAGTWLYPTRFDEISCMGAMEAQAAGCCLVATDCAALKETVNWKSPIAYKISVDDLGHAAQALLDSIRVSVDAPSRISLSEESLERFDWQDVVDQWIEIFSPKPVEVMV